MAFQNGQFARIWEFSDKGNYGVVNMSTSKKNKNTNEYETDFQHKFVTVAGQAYEFVKKLNIPKSGVPVKIGNCATTNKYDANKQTTYWNCAVFQLEDGSFNGNGGNSAPAASKGNKKTSNYSANYANDDAEMQLPF